MKIGSHESNRRLPLNIRIEHRGSGVFRVREIIIRGIERRKIFRDNKDRDNLVERLEHLIPTTNGEMGDGHRKISKLTW